MVPHGDISWCYYPNAHIFQRGWRILTPLMKIYLMLLPQQHIAHRGWRMLIPHGDIVGAITPINILFEGRMLIPHQDKVDVTTPVNILFIGNGEF